MIPRATSLLLLPLLAAPLAAALATQAGQRLEERVNTTTEEEQNDPSLAIDRQGRILVAWSSQAGGGSEVFARLLDPSGNPLGPEVQVNQYTTKNQRDAYVAFGPDGDAWVVWASLDPGSAHNGVFARRLGAAAGFAPRGGETPVASAPAGALEDPAIAVDGAGRLLVAWVDFENGERVVELQRLSSAGEPLGASFRVGDEGGVHESVPDVVALPGGGYFVTWQRTDPIGRPLGILGRRVEEDGTLGAVRAMSPDDGRVHVEASLDVDAQGRLALAWLASEAGDYAVMARRFGPDGRPLSAPFRVDVAARGHRSGATAVCEPDGRLLVAYNDLTGKIPMLPEEPELQVSVRARFFDLGGRPLGDELQVNFEDEGPHAMQIASNGRHGAWSAEGVVALAWSGDIDGDDNGVALSLFLPGAVQAATSAPADGPVALGPLPADAPDLLAPPAPLPDGLRASGFGFVAHDQTGWIPPDPDLAVGPHHIVTQANQEIAWFTKEGVEQHRQDNAGSSGFWAAQGAENFVFDPVAVFDPHMGRFIVANGEHDPSGTSFLDLAVSKTDDPNDGWWKYRHRVESVCSSIDFENLGVDSQAIYIAADCFGAGGNQVFVYDKSIVANGLPLAAPINVNTSPFAISLGATKNYDPGSPAAYFVTSYTNSNSEIEIKAIEDPLGTATVFATTVGVPAYDQPSDAPQLGSSNLLSTIDWRIKNGVVRNGHLYASHGIDDGTGVTRVRWYDFDLRGWPASGQSPVLAQSGTLHLGPGVYTWFPDIGVDPLGDISLSFSRSSSSELASIQYALHLAGDAPGTTRTPVTLQTSTQPYGASRWGDYSGMDEDPSRPGTFWSHAEYSEGPWVTWAGSWSTISPNATKRNGNGINDPAYDTPGGPVIGSTWTAVVVNTFHPTANFAVILGFAAPSAFPISTTLGEILVDPASGMLSMSLQPMGGGQAIFSVPIPSDPNLFGLQLFTQAATSGGGIHLCNAIDLVFAY